MIKPSASERMFALQWWKTLSLQDKMILARKHKPEWTFAMTTMSTSTVVLMYRKENS